MSGVERRTFPGTMPAGPAAASDVPTHAAKVVKLFKSPDCHQNALKNTSGIAYGGGYLWMAANGEHNGHPSNNSPHAGYVCRIDLA